MRAHTAMQIWRNRHKPCESFVLVLGKKSRAIEDDDEEEDENDLPVAWARDAVSPNCIQQAVEHCAGAGTFEPLRIANRRYGRLQICIATCAFASSLSVVSSDSIIEMPRFRVRLVIVVPALTCGLSFFHPNCLFGVLHMVIAESRVDSLLVARN